MSIGIVFDADGRDDADVMLRNAEVAMYAAKRRPGPYAVFEEAMHREAVERLELKADLRRAVEDGELSVVYQPIVDLQFGEVVGLEAIPRWERPGRGPVEPGEVMALAGRMGLIERLGRDLLREACAETAGLLGLASCVPPFTLTLTLSAGHVASPQFTGEVRAALAASGLPAENLALTLQGTALLDDVELHVGRLTELRELGCALGQGHHLFPEMTAAEVADLLREAAADRQSLAWSANVLGDLA